MEETKKKKEMARLETGARRGVDERAMGADRLAKVGKKRAAWPTPPPPVREKECGKGRGRTISRRAVIHQGGMALDFRATRFASPGIDSPMRKKKKRKRKKRDNAI